MEFSFSIFFFTLLTGLFCYYPKALLFLLKLVFSFVVFMFHLLITLLKTIWLKGRFDRKRKKAVELFQAKKETILDNMKRSPEEQLEYSILKTQRLIEKSRGALNDLLIKKEKNDRSLLECAEKLESLEAKRLIPGLTQEKVEYELSISKTAVNRKLESLAKEKQDIFDSIRSQEDTTKRLEFELEELETKKVLMTSQLEMGEMKKIASEGLKEGKSLVEKIEDAVIYQQAQSQSSEDPIVSFEGVSRSSMVENNEFGTKNSLEVEEKPQHEKEKKVLETPMIEDRELEQVYKVINEPKKEFPPVTQTLNPQEQDKKAEIEKKPSKAERMREFFEKK